MTTPVERAEVEDDGAGVGVRDGAEVGDDVIIANDWLKGVSSIFQTQLGLEDIQKEYLRKHYNELLESFAFIREQGTIDLQGNNFIGAVVELLRDKTIEHSRSITETMLDQFVWTSSQFGTDSITNSQEIFKNLLKRYPGHLISVMPQFCPFVVVKRVNRVKQRGGEGGDRSEGGENDVGAVGSESSENGEGGVDPHPPVDEVAAAIDATILALVPDQEPPVKTSPDITQSVNSAEIDAVQLLEDSQLNTRSQLEKPQVDSDTLTAEIATAITVSIKEGQMNVPAQIVEVDPIASANGVSQVVKPAAKSDSDITNETRALVQQDPSKAIINPVPPLTASTSDLVNLFDPTSIAIFKPFEKKPNPSFPTAPTYLDIDVGMPFKYVLLSHIDQLLKSDKDLADVDDINDINHVLALLYNQIYAVAPIYEIAPITIKTFPAFNGESLEELEDKAISEYNDVLTLVTNNISELASINSKPTYSGFLANICMGFQNYFYTYSLYVALWKSNPSIEQSVRDTLSLQKAPAQEAPAQEAPPKKHIAFGPVEESIHSDWDERYEQAMLALEEDNPGSRFEMKLLLSQRLPHKNDKPPPTRKVVVKKGRAEPKQPESSWMPNFLKGKPKLDKKESPYLHFDDAVDDELEKILAKLLPKKGGRPRKAKAKAKGKARSPGTYRLTVRRTQEAE